MRVKRKATILAVLAAALVTSGCAGISAAPAFSPLSLFLPGLVRNEQIQDAPAAEPVQTPETPERDPGAPADVALAR